MRQLKNRFAEKYQQKQREQSRAQKPPRKGKEVALFDDELRRRVMDSIRKSAVEQIYTVQIGGIWDQPKPLTKEQELEQRLEESRRKLTEQDEFLKKITEPGFASGVVVSAKAGYGSVAIGNALTFCNLPDGAMPGDTVRVITKSGQPYDVLKEERQTGEVCTVESVSGDLLIVSHGSGARAINSGGLVCKQGDRVIVERSFHVATQNLGPASASYSLTETTSVTWEDIGGLDDAKEAIREAIEYPLTHGSLYGHYGVAASKGVLLYGPPGCGKTMLGKATATSLRARGSDGGGFIYVKGPEVLSMWVGQAESTVRQLFSQAREHKRRTGFPAVLFIDEAEALLASRSVDGFRAGVQSTLVPAFLAEMDGLEDSGAFVILATNRQDSLDPAIVREGRIDRKIEVSRPGRAQSRRIFELACARIPSETPLADVFCDEVFSCGEVIASARAEDLSVELFLPDIMSGSLATGIVRRAVELAMKRDREAGRQGGVTEDDARQAVKLKAQEQRNLNWTAELFDKAHKVIGHEAVHKITKHASQGAVN